METHASHVVVVCACYLLNTLHPPLFDTFDAYVPFDTDICLMRVFEWYYTRQPSMRKVCRRLRHQRRVTTATHMLMMLLLLSPCDLPCAKMLLCMRFFGDLIGNCTTAYAVGMNVRFQVCLCVCMLWAQEPFCFCAWLLARVVKSTAATEYANRQSRTVRFVIVTDLCYSIKVLKWIQIST